MDLKKKKGFTSNRESTTFATWGKNKVKNKELFPGEFVCVFLLLLKVGKIQLWLSSTVQKLEVFWKVLGKRLWLTPSLTKLQIFKMDVRRPVRFKNSSLWLLRNIQKQPPSEVFWKKGVYKNFAIFPGKHLCPSLLFKSTGAFLWILGNFQKHLFYRTLLVAASEHWTETHSFEW